MKNLVIFSLLAVSTIAQASLSRQTTERLEVEIPTDARNIEVKSMRRATINSLVEVIETNRCDEEGSCDIERRVLERTPVIKVTISYGTYDYGEYETEYITLLIPASRASLRDVRAAGISVTTRNVIVRNPRSRRIPGCYEADEMDTDCFEDIPGSYYETRVSKRFVSVNL